LTPALRALRCQRDWTDEITIHGSVEPSVGNMARVPSSEFQRRFGGWWIQRAPLRNAK
jgi:hypothetical protein